MSDGFLGRWSRRKLTQDQSPAPVLPAVSVRPEGAAQVPARGAAPQPVSPDERAAPATPAVATARTPEPAALPTLDDVKALVSSSDFQPFMARGVAPDVRNAALKKLFADPHYNVMDGLDTYIDDYNTPDPIPAAMFKQLVQARMLGLLDDELEDQVATPSPCVEPAAAELAAGAEPAADPARATGGAEPAALPDASVAQAPPKDGEQPAAPAAVGGRAWESNPPGTA